MRRDMTREQHRLRWQAALNDAKCLFVAQSRHPNALDERPLLGVKRTLIGHALMSTFDPKRKPVGAICCGAQTLSKNVPCTARCVKKADRCARRDTVSITAIRAFDSSGICPTRRE